MSRLVLDIGSIRIDATGRPEEAQRLEAVLREGLERLAEILAASPLARRPEPVSLALSEIVLTDLTAEDWLGPRGAARLAEALLGRILAGRAGG